MSGSIKNARRPYKRLDWQSYWTFINGIIEVGDQEDECQPKQKRFWKLYIKSLRKYVIGSTIRQLKTVQCIKGHGGINSGQYKSVYTKEDQESLVPDPSLFLI